MKIFQKVRIKAAAFLLLALSLGRSSYAAPTQGFGVSLEPPVSDTTMPYLLIVGVLYEGLAMLLYPLGVVLLALNATYAYLKIRRTKSERFGKLYREAMGSLLRMIILGLAGYIWVIAYSDLDDVIIAGVDIFYAVLGLCLLLELAFAVHIIISVIGYPLRAAKDKAATVER